MASKGRPAARGGSKTGANTAGGKKKQLAAPVAEPSGGSGPSRGRQQTVVLVIVAVLALFAAVTVVWARTGGAAAGSRSQLPWIWNDPAKARAEAAAENKPILIDFWASWCVWCKKMDDETYPDPRVQAALKGYVLLKIDTDKMGAFQSQFGVQGLPTSVVLSSKGKEIGRREGYEPASDFVSFLGAPARKT